MARVELTATAHIRNGLMTDENFRYKVLRVFGANAKLLRETKQIAYSLGKVTLSRYAVIDDNEYILTLSAYADTETVVVRVRRNGDMRAEVVGSATFGITKFFLPAFADLDEE